MSELSPLLFGLAVFLLALVIVALTWMMSEITRLRAESRILREQRDFWIDYNERSPADE